MTLANTRSCSIHILGAGSIGQLWALSIRSKLPCYPVTLLLRGNENDIPKNQSLLWKNTGSEMPKEISVPVEYVGSRHCGPIDTLVVTTKSYQAKDAIESVLSNLKPSRVVLLCNGALAVRDEVKPMLSDDIPLILATTTHGAYRYRYEESETSCLVHAGIGKTFIQDQANDLALVWDRAGLNCSTLSSTAMDHLLWKKLAANCVINPLTALFRCNNGELWMEPSFFELQQEILQEVAQVAESYAGSKNGLDEVSLRQFVGQVILDTKDNKSSMLQDVLQEKRTEIDHLNNYIVQKGRSLGLECPANEDVVSRILELPMQR